MGTKSYLSGTLLVVSNDTNALLYSDVLMCISVFPPNTILKQQCVLELKVQVSDT